MHGSRSRDLQRGSSVLGAVLVLLLLALALAGNYVRNYQADQQQAKKAGPYASYGLEELKVLAEGYRQELAAAEARHGGGRVATRDRHYLGDQIQEFERVQKVARNSREQAVDIAQLRGELKKIEEEIGRRDVPGASLSVHLERMFRF